MGNSRVPEPPAKMMPRSIGEEVMLWKTRKAAGDAQTIRLPQPRVVGKPPEPIQRDSRPRTHEPAGAATAIELWPNRLPKTWNRDRAVYVGQGTAAAAHREPLLPSFRRPAAKEGALSLTQRLKYLYLAYFSKPAAERTLYRAIRKRRVRRIVELGVGSGERALRLIAVAQMNAGDEPVRYVGVDLFEGRPAEAAPGLSLKEAHKLMQPSGAKVQFLPGDPFSALARGANGVSGVELLIVAADLDEAALARAWFYVPRMLAERGEVYVEEPSGPSGEPVLRRIDRDELARLAAPPSRQKAA